MNISWKFKKFNELSASELYAIMRLRQEVFILEQNCAYVDCDGKDARSIHLFGTEGAEPAAYARILEPGVSYPEVSIGRIVTAKRYRRTGLGKRLMEEALRRVRELYGEVPVQIGAQTHLVGFYEQFGFRAGEAFVEDGIPHTHMIRPAGKQT